jgi:hypothetical protein
MHWNKKVFRILGPQIPNQIGQLPPNFDSSVLIDRVSRYAPSQYGDVVGIYTSRGYDRAHAEWIAHREITHTLRNKFSHLVVKVGECPNPKGGTMSLWNRL